MKTIRLLLDKVKIVHSKVMQFNGHAARHYTTMKRLHFLNFKYNIRYQYWLTIGMATFIGAISASMAWMVYMVQSGRTRHQSEYYSLWLTNYSPLSVQQQPHMTELYERGMQRGLSSFELLELSSMSNSDEIKYHGQYLAELKQT